MVKDDIQKMTRKQLNEFVIHNGVLVSFDITDTVNSLRDIRNEVEVAFRMEPIAESELVWPTGYHRINKKRDKIISRTPAGTEIKTQFQRMEEISKILIFEDDSEEYDDNDYAKTDQAQRDLRKMRIAPNVYFQFVKSKMNETQIGDMTERMKKIVSFMKTADMLGQRGLYEELANQLSYLVKSQELAVFNCSKSIKVEYINLFLRKVTDKTVKFNLFETFPRVVPKEKAEIIKKVKDAKIFDEMHILFVDYVKQEFKTNKEKIREKDPILFGCFNHDPEVMYYITDWVDEHCDLTLDKLIGEIKVDDPNFVMDDIPELTPEYLQGILKEVETRHSRLKRTNSRNYRELMEEEDSDQITTEEIIVTTDTKKSWFAKIKGMIW